MRFFLERNLNPKAACLKRREEEKTDEGPKIIHNAHNILPSAHYPHIGVIKNEKEN